MLDNPAISDDNSDMTPSTAQTVKRYMKASADFRKAIQKDPRKAAQVLLQAGIIVRSPKTESGFQLAPRLRDGK